jgi:predicted ATP-grasp superfamily ATP-dependent carboligase
MDADEKKILLEHKQMMKELQQDFQKFYQIASKIIPEIERTQTVNRLKAEFEEFQKKSLETS